MDFLNKIGNGIAGGAIAIKDGVKEGAIAIKEKIPFVDSEQPKEKSKEQSKEQPPPKNTNGQMTKSEMAKAQWATRNTMIQNEANQASSQAPQRPSVQNVSSQPSGLRAPQNDFLQEMLSQNKAGESDSEEMDPDQMFTNVAQHQQNRYGRSLANNMNPMVQQQQQPQSRATLNPVNSLEQQMSQVTPAAKQQMAPVQPPQKVINPVTPPKMQAVVPPSTAQQAMPTTTQRVSTVTTVPQQPKPEEVVKPAPQTTVAQSQRFAKTLGEPLPSLITATEVKDSQVATSAATKTAQAAANRITTRRDLDLEIDLDSRPKPTTNERSGGNTAFAERVRQKQLQRQAEQKFQEQQEKAQPQQSVVVPSTQQEPEATTSQTIDFNERRQESTSTAERRTAVRNLRRKHEVLERNSSNSDLTDTQFMKCDIDSDEIEITLQKQENAQRSQSGVAEKPASANVVDTTIQDTIQRQEKQEKEALDGVKVAGVGYQEELSEMMKLIEHNEYLFKSFGEKKLSDQRQQHEQSAKSLSQLKNKSMQSVIEKPEHFTKVTYPPGTKETCIATNGEVFLVGTSTGFVYAFDLKSHNAVGLHKEDGKDFNDNAVTCLSVHPRRPFFCAIGFEKGQIALVDLRKISKTVKLIKDHHKAAVIQVKFCDWIKEKPHVVAQGLTHTCKECDEIKQWMLISCDATGKLVQSTVGSLGGFFLVANENVLLDPQTSGDERVYQVLEPRFSSISKPQEGENDIATIVAMGCREHVAIYETPEKGITQRLVIDKPQRYPSQNVQDIYPVLSQMPILAWGFGRTPRYNFQTFPILAIAWGPLVQLVVFKDINSAEKNADFELDGYYLVAQERDKELSQLDTTLHSLHFLDDSLLVAVTQNREVRVMHTQKFKENFFEEPEYLATVDFEKLDPRCKMMPQGAELTAEQREIELERKFRITQSLIRPMFGDFESLNGQSVFNDKITFLAENGVHLSHHLNWLESLGDLEGSVHTGEWIAIFAKALDIYMGKVKGLRMSVSDDRDHQDIMKDELKQMIEAQVQRIITGWENKADSSMKAGTTTTIQVQEDLSQKYQSLISIVIEFCVEIQEPIFLFDTLLRKFHSLNKSLLFAERLKPYILSGHFVDCEISQSILQEQILQHYQKQFQESYQQIQDSSQKSPETVSAAVSSAENYEKILLNFSYIDCTDAYKLELLEFCRKFGLTSALIYLCLRCYGQNGALQALMQLKDFYLDSVNNRNLTSSVHRENKDLFELYSLPPNQKKRIMLERSSCYMGFKLLWVSRIFLQGKIFPRGFFTTQDWHVLCHDVADFITQDDQIQLLTEIDAQCYFQLLQILFNNPSKQYSFILQGRPQASTTAAQVSMSHALIIKRLATYFSNQANDPARMHFLCFTASVTGTYELDSESQENLCHEIVVTAIKNSDRFIEYCREMLKRPLKNEQLVESLKTLSDPDLPKEIQLAECQILLLIERAKSKLEANKKDLNQLLNYMLGSKFRNVKFVLHELNGQYLKCFQMFIEANRQSNNGKIRDAISWRGRVDGFLWLQEKHAQLEQLANETKDPKHTQHLEEFETELHNQTKFFVKHDIHRGIELCDKIFKSKHLKFITKLEDDKELQLHYMQELLQAKAEIIRETLMPSTLVTISSKPRREAQETRKIDRKKWLSFLSLHVKLVCELRPNQVTQEIEKIIKSNFYPMEDCLKICTEFNKLEAAAILNKKIGNYSKAVELHLRILQTEINYESLKKELFYFDKEVKRHQEKEGQTKIQEERRIRRLRFQQMSTGLNPLMRQQQSTETKAAEFQLNVTYSRKRDLYKVWVEKFGKNMDLLDRQLDRIISICKAHPQEVFVQPKETNPQWKQVLLFLFEIIYHPSLRQKSYCKRHLKQKIVEYCRCILPSLNFLTVLKAANERTGNLRFKAIKELVHDIFSDKSNEWTIGLCAQVTQNRDLLKLSEAVNDVNAGGVEFSYESLACQVCKDLVTPWRFQILHNQQNHCMIFYCRKLGSSTTNHAFHFRCLNSFFKLELEKSKKVVKDLSLVMRCPSCYPDSQEITTAEISSAANKAKQKAMTNSAENNADSDEEVVTEQSTQTLLQQTKVSLEQIVRKQKETKKVHREKLMKQFDMDMTNNQAGY